MRAYLFLTHGPGLEKFKGTFFFEIQSSDLEEIDGGDSKLRHSMKLAVAKIDMTRAALMH